jgi:hypothetical protein
VSDTEDNRMPVPRRATRLLTALATVAAGAAGIYGATALGTHNGDQHSENMRLVANYDDEGTYRVGTDLAFWGETMVAGKLDQGTGPNASPPGGFRVMDISDPSQPREIGQFDCWGDQSDVSIWQDLVIVSVDKPTTEDCSEQSGSWEGIRVVSIADPANPQLLGSVATDCGSHTNTMYADPANGRLLVYALSYPLAGRYNPAGALPTCNAVSHRKFSVVEVPLDNPGEPRLLRTVPVETNIGCHDVTLFLERKLAAAACLTESQMWDISDPAEPEVIARIPNPPELNISHSTAFSNDGRTLVIGDELGGAAASPGCLTGDERDRFGGLFFFDISGDAGARGPEQVGTFKLPQTRTNLFCTAHLFNPVPLSNGRDILVSSWYTGATSVIDFTGVREGEAPEQIAHYIPENTVTPSDQPSEAAAWSSYWYNGLVWSNNFDEDVNSVVPQSRGLDVFAVDHPALQGEVRLSRLNPQVQEFFHPGPGAQGPPQPGAGPGAGPPATVPPASPAGASKRASAKKKKCKPKKTKGKQGKSKKVKRKQGKAKKRNPCKKQKKKKKKKARR